MEREQWQREQQQHEQSEWVAPQLLIFGKLYVYEYALIDIRNIDYPWA